MWVLAIATCSPVTSLKSCCSWRAKHVWRGMQAKQESPQDWMESSPAGPSHSAPPAEAGGPITSGFGHRQSSSHPKNKRKTPPVALSHAPISAEVGNHLRRDPAGRPPPGRTPQAAPADRHGSAAGSTCMSPAHTRHVQRSKPITASHHVLWLQLSHSWWHPMLLMASAEQTVPRTARHGTNPWAPGSSWAAATSRVSRK